MSPAQLAVAGLIALLGPYLAFRWETRTLFRLACVSQGVLGGFTTLLALGTGLPAQASVFAASFLCVLLAGAGVRARALAWAGAALFLTALLWVAVTQGAAPSFLLALSLPALCLCGMAYLAAVHTKQRNGSAPSSARAS